MSALPFQSLTNATDSGAGSSYDQDDVNATQTMFVETTGFSGGGQITVQLQVSHDGTNWAVLNTATVTGNGVQQVTGSCAARYSRANATFSGPTATVNATVAAA